MFSTLLHKYTQDGEWENSKSIFNIVILHQTMEKSIMPGNPERTKYIPADNAREGVRQYIEIDR